MVGEAVEVAQALHLKWPAVDDQVKARVVGRIGSADLMALFDETRSYDLLGDVARRLFSAPTCAAPDKSVIRSASRRT